MSISSTVEDGLSLINGSIGYLGTGATIGNISSSTQNANLGTTMRGVAVVGNTLQLGATAGSLFTVGSAVLSQYLAKANMTGQGATLLSDIYQSKIDIQATGSVSGTTARSIASDITGLVQSGLLLAVANAVDAGASTVVVAGATLAIPEALALAAVVGGVSVVLGYAGLLPDSVQSQISSSFTKFNGLFFNDASSDAGFFQPQVNISAPESVSVSPNGTTVTTTQYGAAGVNSTLIQNYTDSTRQTLASETSTQVNLATGATTTKTLNYNPNGTECTFDQKYTPGTSGDQRLGEISGSENKDGSIATASLSGYIASLTTKGSTIILAQNSISDVEGDSNLITALSNSQGTIHGANNLISEAIGDYLAASGGGNTINAAAGSLVAISDTTTGFDTVNVNGDQFGGKTANGQPTGIWLNGNNAQANLYGSNNGINLMAGDVVGAYGGATVNVSGNQFGGTTTNGQQTGVWLNNNAQANLYGSNNGINLAAGDVVGATGGNNTINAATNTLVAISGTNGAYDSVNVSGDLFGGKTTNGQASGIWFDNGAQANVNGSNNGINLADNDALVVSGNSNTINTGANNAIAVNGTGNTVNAGSHSVVVDMVLSIRLYPQERRSISLVIA